MAPDEMNSLLDEIGWKRADLARRLNIPVNDSEEWDKQGPPPWVGECLNGLADLQRQYLNRYARHGWNGYHVRRTLNPKAPPGNKARG